MTRLVNVIKVPTAALSAVLGAAFDAMDAGKVTGVTFTEFEPWEVTVTMDDTPDARELLRRLIMLAEAGRPV